MAAATALWLRQGDRFAWTILGRWLRLRVSLLARALARGRWVAAHEELLVLGGTFRGLVGGLLAGGRR
jgi:hypothetical protein